MPVASGKTVGTSGWCNYRGLQPDGVELVQSAGSEHKTSLILGEVESSSHSLMTSPLKETSQSRR